MIYRSLVVYGVRYFTAPFIIVRGYRMKLLAICLTGHDHNVSYYDGTCYRFHKFERSKQIKRYRFSHIDTYEREIESLWNISINTDIDEIAYTCMRPVDFINVPATRVDHHLAHALSVNPLIDKTPDISFVIDGQGDGKTWSVIKGNNTIKYATIEHGSIGWGTRDAGMKVGIKYNDHLNDRNDIAGKLMGLISYGSVDEGYLQILRRYGMYDMNEIFNYDNWVSYKKDVLVAELTKLDWAKTISDRTQEMIIDFFHEHAQPDDVISYSGGVAQNVVWNTELKKHFKNLYIAPHSSDEGLSIGCMEWLRQKYDLPSFDMSSFPYIQTDVAPEDTPSDETILFAATELSKGKIIAWYQGHGEMGPRALGNRSILMDPRIPNGKEVINKIKNRENYRPFGASVLEEHARNYFDIDWKDPYMLYVCRVKQNNMPAITHIDGTCRIQTVGDNNVHFRKLLKKFHEITGCPVLLNTSLNIAGKPIAGYPDNALELLANSSLDYAIIGNGIHKKENCE